MSNVCMHEIDYVRSKKSRPTMDPQACHEGERLLCSMDEKVRAHLLCHKAYVEPWSRESAGSKGGRLTIQAPLIRGVSSM